MSGPEAVMGMVVFGSVGATVIILAKAFAKRIEGGGARRGEIETLKDEVAQLRAEVDVMTQRVADVDELHNRLEFAERVIGQIKSRPVLPGGGQ